MGCANSKRVEKVPRENTNVNVAAEPTYAKKSPREYFKQNHGLADEWERLLDTGEDGGSTAHSARTRTLVKGSSSSLYQCVPFRSSAPGLGGTQQCVLLAEGRLGNVYVALLNVSFGPSKCLTPTKWSDNSNSSGRSDASGEAPSAGSDVVVLKFAAAVKEVPLSPTFPTNAIFTLHNVVKEWRQLSMDIEGLVHCLGGEKYTAEGSRNDGDNGSSQYRIYTELCRYGSLHQLQQQFCQKPGYNGERNTKKALHELTARVVLREVLLTLFALHCKGVIQQDLTARSILLQHPIESIYGSLYPAKLGERHMQAAMNEPSSTQWAVPSVQAALKQRGIEKVNFPLPPAYSTKERFQQLAVDARADPEWLDDTPSPPTISTHMLEDPYGGLSIVIPHKFSGPMSGYIANGEVRGVRAQNQRVVNTILRTKREDPTPLYPEVAAEMGLPPPMLMDTTGSLSTVVPHHSSFASGAATSTKTSAPPRFATRLMHKAAFSETYLTAEHTVELAPWKYLSPSHLAPEVFLSMDFSEESDVYSMAVTFVELCTPAAEGGLPTNVLQEYLPKMPQSKTTEEHFAYKKQWFDNLKTYYANKVAEENRIHRIASSRSFNDSCASIPPGCSVIPVHRGQVERLVLYPPAIPIPSHLSPACHNVLMWCLQLNPERRPSASELLASSFFCSQI